MSDDGIEQARRWFAEELRLVARVEDPRVVDAFASVPRERFVGPGPLRILSFWNMKDYWTPPDVGPAAVYHDVLIAYDEQRRLNNGQPSLWAFVFDKLGVARGERVVHLGCGMGYYSAILAELVGPTGTILAIEIDELLAGRAREALAQWPQITVVNGDGTNASWRESDVVVASAGATHSCLAHTPDAYGSSIERQRSANTRFQASALRSRSAARSCATSSKPLQRGQR